MVIDYQILNDNTIDDAYDIPDKTKLINKIQKVKYLVKLTASQDSGRLKCIMIVLNGQFVRTSPLGHYEWLIMPFG